MRLSIFVLFFVASIIYSCGKKSSDSENTEGASENASDPDSDSTEATDESEGDDSTGPKVTGTLAIDLGLLASSVTHVVAQDTDENKTVIAEVEEDGSFSLPIKKDKNWVLSYVNSDETGEDMLVATFGAGELDTIAASEDVKNIELGEVDVSADKASAETSDSDLYEAMGISGDSADAFGAIDDVALRYSNPDIDNNGKIDADEKKSFPLDFHNRFSWKNSSDSSNYGMEDIKNAFIPFDSTIEFGGSGIYPEFELDDYDSFNSYTWTFTAAVNIATNGGQLCDGMAAGEELAAGTACELALDGGQSVEDHPGIELAAAVDGDYTLAFGDNTFTWTNVKVSDFSAGEGFIALFLKMDVNASDMLTGVSYSWRKKSSSGTYELATAEELKLVVSSGGGYVSFKIDGMDSGKQLGVSLPLEPEGSVAFATAKYGSSADVSLDSSGLAESELKSSGVAWSRVLENIGVSYDDKLGMRFFFGYDG